MYIYIKTRINLTIVKKIYSYKNNTVCKNDKIEF